MAQLTGRDLVIVAPDRGAFRDLLHRFDDTDEHLEICLDRRRGERRRSEESSISEGRRRRERRSIDVSQPLRATGWVIIPAAQRS
jgi:hypothetical protein